MSSFLNQLFFLNFTLLDCYVSVFQGKKLWLPLKQRKDSTWGRHKVWRNCTCSSVQNYSVDVVHCNAVKKTKVLVHFCRFQLKAFFFLFLEKLMRKNPPTTCAWLEGREKRLFKVHILWEGHKITKKYPTLFWNYLVQGVKAISGKRFKLKIIVLI